LSRRVPSWGDVSDGKPTSHLHQTSDRRHLQNRLNVMRFWELPSRPPFRWQKPESISCSRTDCQRRRHASSIFAHTPLTCDNLVADSQVSRKGVFPSGFFYPASNTAAREMVLKDKTDGCLGFYVYYILTDYRTIMASSRIIGICYWGHSTNTTLTRAQSSVQATGLLRFCLLPIKTGPRQGNGCFQSVGVVVG
jgi:hypothetical protein